MPKNNRNATFTLIYVPLCYFLLYWLLRDSESIHRAIVLGGLVGVVTSPIYGPYLWGHWTNRLSDSVRKILESGLFACRSGDSENSRKTDRSTGTSIGLLVLSILFLLAPFLVLILLLRPFRHAIIFANITMIGCWAIVDALASIVAKRGTLK